MSATSPMGSHVLPSTHVTAQKPQLLEHLGFRLRMINLYDCVHEYLLFPFELRVKIQVKHSNKIKCYSP